MAKLEPLFQTLPEDLAALSDDDLSALESHYVEGITKVRDKDEEFLGSPDERPATEILAELRAAKDALDAIRAVQGERAEAEANFDAEVEAVASEALAAEAEKEDAEDEDKDKDGKADPEDEAAAADAEALAADAEKADAEKPEDEAAADAEAEQAEVTAATVPARNVRRGSSRHAPVVMANRAEQGARLTATMEFGGVRGGTALDRDALVSLLDDAIVRTEGQTGRTTLASARASWPTERYMSKDPSQSHRTINGIREQIREMGMEEIVASGGRCAPFTPRYDLPFIATDDTPVWNSLPQTGADRGGITFPTPLGISDAAPGITVVTADDDAEGGGSATKNCVVVDCDEFQDAETAAIAGCVQHGNFGARSWPERVDNLSDLLRVAHAQASEARLLTLIKAASTALADEAKYGAVSTLLQGMVKAGAFMRNRNRMDRNAVLSALIPAWVIDLMVVDVNHVAFNRFVAQAAMEAQLRAFNINPTFYIDSASGGAMTYGAEAGPNLQEFKTTVEWGLYPPDTFLGLDGGRLDLGLVRDSVLNATNDFQLFFETWIGVAKIGVEALWITSTVCPSGATAPAGTLITC